MSINLYKFKKYFIKIHIETKIPIKKIRKKNR